MYLFTNLHQLACEHVEFHLQHMKEHELVSPSIIIRVSSFVKLLGSNSSDAKPFTLLASLTCNRIWWHRNKLIFENATQHPNPTLMCIHSNV